MATLLAPSSEAPSDTAKQLNPIVETRLARTAINKALRIDAGSPFSSDPGLYECFSHYANQQLPRILDRADRNLEPIVCVTTPSACPGTGPKP